MLQHLAIENYALIKSLDISFSSGFSAITGETGAGKSIILGALGLILGQRADTAVLLDKEKKCIIEGSFDISGLGLDVFFTENDIDFEKSCILRREITPNGKSRAFINDTPVSLGQLKILGERLVDIHSQHKTLTLGESGFQLELLDLFTDKPLLKKHYIEQYRNYKKIQKELNALKESDDKNKQELDYFEFLFNELYEAKLSEDEQELLENQLSLLNNAENIKAGLSQAEYILNENEYAISAQLNAVKNILSKFPDSHPTLASLNERINSCSIELKDISNEIVVLNEEIHFSEEELERIGSRLDLIYRLQKKHHANTIKELLDIQNELDSKLQNIKNTDENILRLETLLNESGQQLSNLANKLSEERKASAQKLESQLLPLLGLLGMPHAQFCVFMETADTFMQEGKDLITFLFNANAGGTKANIAKIASGGELSRLMLALKSLITQKTLLPTIIFDEIDSGVSGDIAGKVGNIMSQMSKNMQVIAITHLPQIAAKADNHFKVYKQVTEGTTLSSISSLTAPERIEELAKMLSSSNIPSSSAINMAKELMDIK